MRVYALYVVVAALAVYSLKDWFKSLCGLIVLMALIEHEDMPRSIMGVQGLNLWNVLITVIVVSWAASRQREGLRWDMPRLVGASLLACLGIVLVGWVRMYADPAHMSDYSLGEMVSEELINTVKWVIPGLLVFDGCRDRRRLKWVLGSVLLMLLLLALQLAKRMPAAAAMGGDSPGIQRLRLKMCLSIGYSSVAMSVMLAGASWAFVSMAMLFRKRWQLAVLVVLAGLTAYTTALTGGRAGYLAWGVVGLALCLIRWRRALLLAPAVLGLLYIMFPAAVQRLMVGTGEVDPSGRTTVNEKDLSSGRFDAWPHVVRQIGHSPAIGYGRRGMVRTGLTYLIAMEHGEGHEEFPHPHNMYLEWILDNGLIGFAPVVILFGWVLVRAGSLFRDRKDALFAAAGGVALSLILSQLVGGMTSQHFYPRESTLPMWVMVLLVVRLHVERERTLQREALAQQRRAMPSMDPARAPQPVQTGPTCN